MPIQSPADETNLDDTSDDGTLTVQGKSYELPVYNGSIGPDVIDISRLYGQTGVFTYDPGFTSTASCESKITYIDGGKGTLLHRGYPIDQLAENQSSDTASWPGD